MLNHFCCKVYPRVGGATPSSFLSAGRRAGLSPRGRGNHPIAWRHELEKRSIPAWAGQPPTPWESEPSRRVYPRVGGATRPRGPDRHHSMGLSPRGRGNLPETLRIGSSLRSIPAWAGQPSRPAPPSPWPTVYPRVGGATPGVFDGRVPGQGLSPRGRGNLPAQGSGPPLLGSIPAWAGQPDCRALPQLPGRVYPRVGGATLWPWSRNMPTMGLSPRGRGNLPLRRLAGHRPGSIPAWAGQP